MSKEEILSKTIEGYLEFCLKEKNLIRLLHLKPPIKEAKMRGNLEEIKRQINSFFQKKLKRVSKNPEFIHYLLAALEGIAMKVKNSSKKKLNAKKIASQITKAYFVIESE